MSDWNKTNLLFQKQNIIYLQSNRDNICQKVSKSSGIQMLAPCNQMFTFSNSVCVTTFSERYNDRVIDICSSCRQSVEDVDIPDTFQL